MKTATTNPEDLVKVIGNDMMPILKEQGHAIVREIVTEANKQGIPPKDFPYILWALAQEKTLPDMGLRVKGYRVLWDIMTRTGALPAYHKAFEVTKDPVVDAAVDAIALYMSVWSIRILMPFLTTAYLRVLTKHVKQVPQVTDGTVSEKNGTGYLNYIFREVLDLRSSMFEDGELLRRVMQIIPEW